MLSEHPRHGSSPSFYTPSASSAMQGATHTSRPLRAWDLSGMLAGFLLVLSISIVNSRGLLPWEDEMLGSLLLRDPSWTHMVHAWKLGADGGGFLFYLLGRGWFHLFGDRLLTFRLFSATCFGLAFSVLWLTLRRVFSLPVTAFAAFNTFFFSPPLTTHFMEGRFYGLLVLNTALALWLVLKLDATPSPAPRHIYLLAFVIHALLATSHVLGVVYSAFLLASVILLDHLRHRPLRWGLYLAAACSWLLLLPEKTAIVAAARVGKPHFWTKAPTPREIVGAFTGFSPEILIVLTLLLLCSAALLFRSPVPPGTLLHARLRRHLAILVPTAGLLLVPVWFLLQGLVGTWLFSDRYLQPVTLAVTCVTAEFLSSIAESQHLRRFSQGFRGFALLGGLAAFFGYALLLFFWVFHHVAQLTPAVPDFTAALTARLPQGIPVVLEDAYTFSNLMSREAGSPVQYTFLLDWPYALSPRAPRLEVTQFHLMENWKLAGYFPDHIQYAAIFLQQHDRFLVVQNGIIPPEPPRWAPEIGNSLAARLAKDPAWHVQKYFTFDRMSRDNARDTVWLVCRGPCSLASLPPQPDLCMQTGSGVHCCSGPDCDRLPRPAPPRFWQIRRWWNRRAP